jgi:acetyl-CoA C-acetyltransferase
MIDVVICEPLRTPVGGYLGNLARLSASEWGISPDDECLNPTGSGISLGHPVGATGARILATMAYELQRTGGRNALETMCIGGGQGLAAVSERVA